MNDATENTDLEIYREDPGEFYSDNMFVTKDGGIGINCGGSVYVKPLREWHKLAEDAHIHPALTHGTWQPIETAPKDETEVIGCYCGEAWSENHKPTNYGPWTMAFSLYHNKWLPSWYGMRVIESESDFGIDYQTLDMQPTHWMPLPEPPNAK